jgi:hypothetical protein
MKILRLLPVLAAAGLLTTSSAFAQSTTTPTPQTQDGKAPATKQQTQGQLPMVGPASGAYKQQTQGQLPMVGPASGAYKQRTQSMAHSDPSDSAAE